MSTLNPAAHALIQALAAPGIDDAARAALTAALTAVMTPAAAPVVATPGRVRKVAAPMPERKAETIKFGKESLAALALPVTGERYVYDTECPQLAVRLRPGGKTYIVQQWDRQRRRSVRVTLGKVEAVTPDDARRRARAMVADVGEGVDVRRDRDTGLTVRQLVQSWHEEKSKSKATADELRDKVLHYLGKHADRPAREVGREDVGRIHHDIATKARKRVFKTVNGSVQPVEVGEPGMPATADKWRATLHAVYAWAVSKGMTPTNPCEGIKQAFDAKQAARTNYLRGDELLRFWAALDADSDTDTRDALKLMLFTGQRRGNVLAMRWADVDLQACVWSLNAKQTKQKRAQTTPLVAQAVTILKARWKDAATPWVFPATRSMVEGKELGTMSETRLRDAWKRVCEVAKISDMRPHDLRHTSGSWLARLGANEAIRQKALGHQTSAMAARYSHLELDPVADALQRVANAVEAEATKRTFKGRAQS